MDNPGQITPDELYTRLGSSTKDLTVTEAKNLLVKNGPNLLRVPVMVYIVILCFLSLSNFKLL